MCVCECDSLKEHMVANSALYVFTVNGWDSPKYILCRNRILDVLGRKLKMLCNNYLFDKIL